MEWIVYLLVGILVAYIHSKVLDYRVIDTKWMWESILIAAFWPVVLVIDAMVVFI